MPRPWWEHALRLDRRLLFVAVALAVAIPVLFPLGLPVVPGKESRDFFAALEQLQPGDVILFSFDYEADSRAEMDPMTRVVWRYCLGRGVRIIALTNYAGGPGVAEPYIELATKQLGQVYGEDVVFLGYNPDYSGTILRLGESFRATFPADQYGRSTADFPLLQRANRYADTKLIVTIAASSLAEYWTIWAHGKYDAKVIAGATAIQAVHLYPYYQTGQVSGFLGGLKGAAELERLAELPGDATRGMDSQTTGHAVIVLFILLGNVAYFAQRRRKS